MSERVRTEIAKKIIRFVLPSEFTRFMKIAESENSNSGVEASIDSEKTLRLYSSFKIGRSGPIRIRPALILIATRKIGRLFLRAAFMG
jgi:hypothetical protein